jgi:prepilin-type N-terminal cleavage/methylation domain-containing protein
MGHAFLNFRSRGTQPRISMRGSGAITHQPRMHMRGFTLIELLVVLSIIIVILAIAVPVWSTLSGNNGVSTAQNQIAAMLGNARSDAMYNKQPMGVFFFIDPASGQSAMAEVQEDQIGTANSYTYTPTTISPNGTAQANGAVTALELANYLPTTAATGATKGTQQYIFYREAVLLPAGVGVALTNNSSPYGASAGIDRYLRFGVIMFDATGALTTIPYAVPMARQTPYVQTVNTTAPSNVDQLAVRLGLITEAGTNPAGDLASLIPPPAGGTNVYPLVSQLGVLLYDSNAYLNQKAIDAGSASFTNADMQCDPPPFFTAPSTQQKADEETWLDANGVAFLVSPFDGSLIKAK